MLILESWIHFYDKGALVERDNTLVWIDCEMTGLDPATSVLLEIATIVTDNNLNVIEEGPSIVIYHDESKLTGMKQIVRDMHTISGLLSKIKDGILMEQAEQKILSFLQQHCKPGVSPMCGNSIWVDRMFLTKYMPRVVEFLNYRVIDVSSVKELVARWHPNDPDAEFLKKKTHRAVDDIRESIAELRHYKKYFFV